VDIAADDRAPSRLERGGSFGEIALLRDVPRTATVTAVGPVRLAFLERDRFIAAVTGHRASAAAADDVVRGHLGHLGRP
jgi:CRP-like cAMP-binding protein